METSSDKQPEALLKHLGMTEYEAKAYLSILSAGSLTAEKISRMSKIPLPRVYDTMASLARRGLISISKTRPQLYKATDPKQISSILEADETRMVEERIKEIKNVVPKLLESLPKMGEKIEGENEEITTFVKRKANTEKIWSDLHDQAKNEILIFAGDMSWIIKYSHLIKNVIRRGVKYRILFSSTSKIAEQNLKKLLKYDLDARFSKETGNFRGFVIDGRKASILQLMPTGEMKEFRESDTDAEKFAEFTTIVIGNKPIVDVLKNYFSILWERSIPAEKFLSMHKSK